MMLRPCVQDTRRPVGEILHRAALSLFSGSYSQATWSKPAGNRTIEQKMGAGIGGDEK